MSKSAPGPRRPWQRACEPRYPNRSRKDGGTAQMRQQRRKKQKRCKLERAVIGEAVHPRNALIFCCPGEAGIAVKVHTFGKGRKQTEYQQRLDLSARTISTRLVALTNTTRVRLPPTTSSSSVLPPHLLIACVCVGVIPGVRHTCLRDALTRRNC